MGDGVDREGVRELLPSRAGSRVARGADGVARLDQRLHELGRAPERELDRHVARVRTRPPPAAVMHATSARMAPMAGGVGCPSVVSA